MCRPKPVCLPILLLPGTGVNCSLTAGYIWNFGDGSPASNVINPCHIYAAPGTYTVTLTGNNFCGSSTHSTGMYHRPANTFFYTGQYNRMCSFCSNTTNTSTDPANCGNATYLWTVTYAAGFCGTTPSWNFTNGTTATFCQP